MLAQRYVSQGARKPPAQDVHIIVFFARYARQNHRSEDTVRDASCLAKEECKKEMPNGARSRDICRDTPEFFSVIEYLFAARRDCPLNIYPAEPPEPDNERYAPPYSQLNSAVFTMVNVRHSRWFMRAR